eukprot:6683766-Prymnesium_polylepis.1
MASALNAAVCASASIMRMAGRTVRRAAATFPATMIKDVRANGPRTQTAMIPTKSVVVYVCGHPSPWPTAESENLCIPSHARGTAPTAARYSTASLCQSPRVNISLWRRVRWRPDWVACGRRDPLLL